MARINIEDKWWIDPRRDRLAFLLNSFLMADGLALKLWRLSQEYWKGSKIDEEKKLIPLNKFEFLEFKEKLLEAKLCEIRDEGVYVFGSEEHHEWLLTKKKNGQKGGFKKSDNVKKQKELAKSSESYQNLASSSESWQNLAKSSESYPPTLPLPLTPTLPLTPKENKNNIAQNSVSSVSDFSKIEIQKGIEAVYQRYPKKLGKAKGMAKLQRTIKTESDLRALEGAITRFISFHDKNLTEKQFVPYWSTWANSWKDWLDPETGSSEDFSKKSDDSYERAFEKIRLAEEQRQQKENDQDVSR